MAHSANSNITASVVVGVGASAGGVEALGAFLDKEQGGSRAAFLVAMHLAPQRQSHLSEILARHTRMRVVQAEDGMLLAPDSVYVLPPGMVMTVNEHTLRVLPTPPSERGPTVIDRMFNSMAEVFGERAIGVVLSGTGDDGALGLKAIKESGGLTIAQIEDGITPLFSGMPQSAIAAGAIDVQLSVADMGGRLDAAIRTLGGQPSPSEGPQAEHATPSPGDLRPDPWPDRPRFQWLQAQHLHEAGGTTHDRAAADVAGSLCRLSHAGSDAGHRAFS